jgi:4-hydroxy-3-polyprenylbenzoate decarboxylase
VSIDKQFDGHAQKVTNAMWGAGQMMFNKMLVIVDKSVDLTNYYELAKTVSKHVDVKNDLMLAQGPMDVLDHACSKFAFGGKLSVDGTSKYEEEINHPADNDLNLAKSQWNEATKSMLLATYTELVGINDTLLQNDISAIIISVNKSKNGHLKQLTTTMFALPEFKQIKVIMWIEAIVNVDSIKDCVWRLSNNYDPKRDTYFVDAIDDGEVNHVALDGTRKTKEHDGFEREWPNIIVADDATIQSVDAKWSELNLGELIPSPSLPYKVQVYNDGAVAL